MEGLDLPGQSQAKMLSMQARGGMPGDVSGCQQDPHGKMHLSSIPPAFFSSVSLALLFGQESILTPGR